MRHEDTCLSWGLGIFVFMKNHLVPVKSWKPVFKRRNSATLKKGHSIQVIINPTLQKCEHSPVVVKKTQIVFCPGAEPTNPECCLDLHCGDYPHPVPRATTKYPTSICVRQTPVPRTMQRGQNTAKFWNPGVSSCSPLFINGRTVSSVSCKG